MATVLVTGATGTVGAHLVRALAARGDVDVRAATRTPTARLATPRVTPVQLEFGQPSSFAAALREVDHVFLVVPSLPDQVGATLAFVAAARAAGVRHLVKLSAMGCDESPTIAFGRAHRDAERGIEASALPWTFLRPTFFMEDTLGAGLAAPDATGAIHAPWGDARCAFVAAADIAAVAARVLGDVTHAGRSYDLTGPAAVTLAEIAGHIAAASGRAVRYAETPDAVACAALAAARLPPPRVEGVMEVHRFARAGRAARITNTIADLLGRPATSFDAFAREHAAAWTRRMRTPSDRLRVDAPV